MAELYDLGPRPTVAIAKTSTRFPVRRVYCVGRNYEDHAKEMGHQADRETPFFFMKPADAIVADGSTISYAWKTKNLHHEVELVVAIGREAANIPAASALDVVYGYTVGNDLTRRDLQNAAKDKGRPWEIGKSFDQSAPIGTIHPVEDVGHIGSGRIWLTVNGKTRQDSDVSAMVWSVPELISFFSSIAVLKPGDIIYTGTPAGVGPIVSGDEVVCGIDKLGQVTTRIA